MTTIEADRSALAQGVCDATADLRELSLHDVVEGTAGRGHGPAGMYQDGYTAVLNQAELRAWDLWSSSRPAASRLTRTTRGWFL